MIEAKYLFKRVFARSKLDSHALCFVSPTLSFPLDKVNESVPMKVALRLIVSYNLASTPGVDRQVWNR
jgi:hypothetical protein